MPTVLHTRAALAGSTENLDKFFSLVKSDELRTNKYLNDITGFEALDEEEYINALVFFVEHVFRDRLIVVKSNATKLSATELSRVRAFMKHNAPLGYPTLFTTFLESLDSPYDAAIYLDDSLTFLLADDPDVYFSFDGSPPY